MDMGESQEDTKGIFIMKHDGEFSIRLFQSRSESSRFAGSINFLLLSPQLTGEKSNTTSRKRRPVQEHFEKARQERQTVQETSTLSKTRHIRLSETLPESPGSLVKGIISFRLDFITE